jgi:hypothetical protein
MAEVETGDSSQAQRLVGADSPEPSCQSMSGDRYLTGPLTRLCQ